MLNSRFTLFGLLSLLFLRLWFLRLDATYPWSPVLMYWRAGELACYAAMLVLHQVTDNG